MRASRSLPDPVPIQAPGGKVADARAAQLTESTAAWRRRLAGLAPRAAGSTPGRRTVSAAKAPTLRLLEWKHLSTTVVAASSGDGCGGKAAGAQVPRRRKVRTPKTKRPWAADDTWDDSFLEWSQAQSAVQAQCEEVPGHRRARRQRGDGNVCVYFHGVYFDGVRHANQVAGRQHRHPHEEVAQIPQLPEQPASGEHPGA